MTRYEGLDGMELYLWIIKHKKSYQVPKSTPAKPIRVKEETEIGD